MKHIFVLLIVALLTAGCTWIIEDTRTPEEKALAATIAAERAALEEDEADDVACEIKVNNGNSGLVYHLPDGVYYDRVKIDLAQGDLWVCSEEEAVVAGARKASR